MVKLFELTRDHLLAPSALTELNLKRYFARSEAEQVFAHAAERAGDPRPEPGWRPALHERLLVKIGADWFTGYVREIDGDTAQVTLSSPQRSVIGAAVCAERRAALEFRQRASAR